MTVRAKRTARLERAGEWVKCKVMSVDMKRGRVALSLKQMLPDPLTQNLESVMPSVDDADVRCLPLYATRASQFVTLPCHV